MKYLDPSIRIHGYNTHSFILKNNYKDAYLYGPTAVFPLVSLKHNRIPQSPLMHVKNFQGWPGLEKSTFWFQIAVGSRSL